jgi:hypothetical protein
MNLIVDSEKYMKHYQYQVILLGDYQKSKDLIMVEIKKQVADLGITDDVLYFIEPTTFSNYRANNPTVVLYFGSSSGIHQHIDLLQILQNNQEVIIPLVSDLKLCKKELPNDLSIINAFELKGDGYINSLVSCILENFGLLRKTRRLFISYKREDSQEVAIQLYEALDAAGFDVFLDTHSIRPGDVFQDELWHRMADTDVVVLLNTSNFDKSRWTMEELAKANDMTIGIFQIIWDGCNPLPSSDFSTNLLLSNTDLNRNHQLSTDKVHSIIQKIESMRARCLAARQDNICTEFLKILDNNKLKNDLLRFNRAILFKTKCNKKYAVIPAIGIPKADTCEETERLKNTILSGKIKGLYILYDHRNIRDRWLTHLEWLNKYVPVKTLKLLEAEKWINRIK